MAFDWQSHVTWIFSGVGIPIVWGAWKFFRPKRNKDHFNETKAPSETKSISIEVTPVLIPEFRHELGCRLKELRERWLKVTKRQLADFFGFDSVSELERFEKGDKELPKSLVDKLVSELHISRDFLDNGSEFIFSMFDLRSEEIDRYMALGYNPKIFSPSKDVGGYSHIYFCLCRPDGHIPSMIISDVPGSFQSTGGGWGNIQAMIDAMIRRKLSPYIPCCALSEAEWDDLRRNRFYDEYIARHGRYLNHEVQDQFVARYNETVRNNRSHGTK